ncbi:MAG: hypothetical protein ACTSQJ_01485 [Promethearchaeota archaeon]
MFQTLLTPLQLFWGIFFCILSSLLFASGIILQKKAVMEMPEIKLSDVSSMTSMLKNKTWVIGILLALAGGPFYFLSQAFIGVTLSQPITLGLQLAFIVLFAIKILDEKIGKIEAIGFGILVSSPILLAFGGVTSPNIELWSSKFIIALFLLFFIPIIILCAIFFLIIPKVNEVSKGLLFAIISGVIFAIGAIFAQIAVESLKVGLTIQLLLIGILCFILMIFGNTIATVLQQLAFQKGKVGIAIALQSTANLLLAIYGGLIIFNQLILTPIFFTIGIIMIFIGNILLIQFQTRLEKIEIQKAKEILNLNPDDKNVNFITKT